MMMKLTRIRQWKCNCECDAMELIGSCCFANIVMNARGIHLLHKSLPLSSNPWTETKIIINATAITKSLTYRNFFMALSQPNLPANGTVECSRKTEDRHLQAYSFKVGASDTGIGTVSSSGHFLFLLRPMMSDQGHYIPLQAIMNNHVTMTRRFWDWAYLEGDCTTNIFIWMWLQIVNERVLVSITYAIYIS